ncbi:MULTISPECIES: peroxidase family protein [Okeania]|uniref:peroxidase family protein n=1 Tax=Okeania TaxID=1458928 RepID=UPI000F530ED0|nr:MULTISPECIES: peroxidase family protein [Okeania]NET15797.1 peroxiredoxin [Okeania sp. SIO1H6]NES77307.1 peroxiredoxin [Okeania sp. SIO1H4]NET18142.1 peroxiredoxin [Okeania sp. SIO1H5]NET76238.1 peroxiredoxin [Okeania sp. SIO1F9]NET93960.1 peroxiredoxin [Okeania sp. SIO1H2]
MNFRTFDGSNNNLDHPQYGGTGENLLRLAPANYEDGISELVDGPNARFISNTVFNQSESILNPRNLSDYTWLWGQFLDHDITLSELQSGPTAETISIPIPNDDPVFVKGSLIPVTRSLFDENTGTDLTNPRHQFNEITAWIDGSNVYGSDQERADFLRSFDGGKLKVTAHSTGDLLLTRGDDEDAPHMAMEEAMGANTFLAGDVRANENSALTSIHTLFVREHNRIAEIIEATHTDLPLDPIARDEEIYQRARKIVGAQIQKITYDEFLPALGVTLDPYTGYDSTVNPNISTEFSTAGFRLGHTMVSPTLQHLNEDGSSTEFGPLNLSEVFFRPDSITEKGGIDPILRGLASQVQQKTDAKVIDDLRNQLFGPPSEGPVVNGTDLAALNIQRGRDHGLARYNDVREALGLPRKDNFSDISSDPELVASLEAVYSNVDEIDLWVGMLAEDNLQNSSIGELNEAILEDQFERLRDGDRFWYENDTHFAEWELGDGVLVSDWLGGLQLSDIIKSNTGIENISENVFFVSTSTTPVPNINDGGPTSLIILASFLMIGRLWKMLPTINRQSSDRS